jgi:hypothetical protein
MFLTFREIKYFNISAAEGGGDIKKSIAGLKKYSGITTGLVKYILNYSGFMHV